MESVNRSEPQKIHPRIVQQPPFHSPTHDPWLEASQNHFISRGPKIINLKLGDDDHGIG